MAAAAGHMRIWKKYLEKLKKAGAVSDKTAVSLEEADISESWILKELIWLKEVRKTEDGRYYVVCKDKKHC